MADFFSARDEVVAGAGLVVDRPAGSPHPRFPHVIYPVSYGHLAGTVSGDGEGADFFRGTAAGLGITAVISTVDTGKRDLEAKILLDCDPDEASAVGSMLSNGLHLGTHLVRRDTAAGT